MRTDTAEAIFSIHNRAQKLLDSARAARNSLKGNDKERDKWLMLCGKVKAYTDVLCQIECRYSSDIKFRSRRYDGQAA